MIGLGDERDRQLEEARGVVKGDGVGVGVGVGVGRASARTRQGTE